MLLNRINESLDKKYQLNEKMSDSMPDWLAKRILTMKYTPNYKNGPRGSDLKLHKGTQAEKSPDFGPARVSYTNPRDDNDRQNIFSKFLDAGIDLSSVEVIEDALPQKRTDPKLKDPYMPIFLFPNNQVYVKGINDNEEYMERSSDKYGTAFKYLPMKTLLSEPVKFAYIKKDNDANFKANDKKVERRKVRDEIRNIPNYNRLSREETEEQRSMSWRRQPDKSGYYPDPHKYDAALAKLKVSKISDDLSEAKKYLEEARDQIFDIQRDLSIEDLADMPPEVEKLESTLKYAARYYGRIFTRVDAILNSSEKDEDRKQQELEYIIQYDGDYKNLNDYIAELKKLANKHFDVTLDF